MLISDFGMVISDCWIRISDCWFRILSTNCNNTKALHPQSQLRNQQLLSRHRIILKSREMHELCKSDLSDRKLNLPIEKLNLLTEKWTWKTGRCNNEGEITRKTTKKWSFHIKYMPAGNYKAFIRKPMYFSTFLKPFFAY